MAEPLRRLRERVQSYLGNGGFFNPESMEHDKVRALIIDLEAALPPVDASGKRCNCWLGTDSTFGDSDVRRACPVHGDPVDASGEPAIDLTNHHNAARCPYCNPLLDTQFMEMSRLKADAAYWKGEFDKLRAAAAVPSSPAQADLVRALHTVAMTIADALSGKAVDFRKALRLIHDMQFEARDGSLTLSALPPSPAQPSMVDALKDAVQTARNYYMLFHEDVWKARLAKWEAALPPSSPVADQEE